MSSRGRRPGPVGSFCPEPACRAERARRWAAYYRETYGKSYDTLRREASPELRERYNEAQRAKFQEYKERTGESYFKKYRPAQGARRKARIGAGEELPHRQRYPEAYKGVDDRRRARKRGADAETFTRGEIYERDGWVCQICGWPVDPGDRYPLDQSASLDHVRPLSKGGAHTRDNSRLAHLLCNIKRGANDPDWKPRWAKPD